MTINTKTLRNLAILGMAPVFLAACSSHQEPPTAVENQSQPFRVDPAETTGITNNQYPERGSYTGAYQYAKSQMKAGDYREAAIWFEKASQTADQGTTDKIWEYENTINASYAWLKAGERDKAAIALRKAESFDVYAPESDRATFLKALLGNGDDSQLPPQARKLLK